MSLGVSADAGTGKTIDKMDKSGLVALFVSEVDLLTQ
jgi:hypothetical protein